MSLLGLWDTLHLNMEQHRVVTLVGGGGKTTLMYTLAHEARQAGKTVVVTTTTHIMPHPRLLLTDNPDPAHLRDCLAQHGILTLGAMGRLDKLCGTGEIALCKALADVVLVEGDGARLHPLKAPAEHEPVIPPEADAVLAVAGMDCLGKPIGVICHRPERVCALLDKPLEALVEPEDVAQLLSSPQGGRKHVELKMGFRCVLNKADVGGTRTQEIIKRLETQGIFARATQFKEEERGGLCWF